MSKNEGREVFYGMPFADWKALYQTDASPAKQAEFDVAFAENVGKDNA